MQKISLITNDFVRKGKLINWKSNIPKNIKFKINNSNLEDEIKLIGYNDKNNLLILQYYDDEPFEIEGSKFIKGQFFIKVNHFKKKEIIKTKNGEVLILDCYRKKKNTYTEWFYKYECPICKNVDEISHGNLTTGYGCNVCGNVKVKKDYNSLGHLRPDLIKYFKNKEDSYLYSLFSSKKVELVCPNCNSVTEMQINNLANRRFYCKACDDGISYPNKLMFNILNSIGVEFVPEKSFDWSCGRRYDFYISNLNIVIEMMGNQHYRYTGRGRSLEEEQKNDRMKEELAEENNLIYISINCSDTRLENIKQNIMDSKLKDFINLETIDWVNISILSESSILLEVCKSWDNIRDTKKLAQDFKINRSTVHRYLHRGNLLGICNYVPYSK